MNRAPAIAGAVLVALAACGAPRATSEFVFDARGGQWLLRPVGEEVVTVHPIEPDFVEVSGDGRTLTVFFLGGSQFCTAVADVRVTRADPRLPIATVMYGFYADVKACPGVGIWSAARVPLDPPFAP